LSQTKGWILRGTVSCLSVWFCGFCLFFGVSVVFCLALSWAPCIFFCRLLRSLFNFPLLFFFAGLCLVLDWSLNFLIYSSRWLSFRRCLINCLYVSFIIVVCGFSFYMFLFYFSGFFGLVPLWSLSSVLAFVSPCGFLLSAMWYLIFFLGAFPCWCAVSVLFCFFSLCLVCMSIYDFACQFSYRWVSLSVCG
jgi:hypothetical protein